MSSSQTSTIFIVAVLAVALYLIYSQSQQNNMAEQYQQLAQQMTARAEKAERAERKYPHDRAHNDRMTETPQYPQQQPQLPGFPPQPNITQVSVQPANVDPYADAIKRQDLYTMNDPLTYPQLRLPREVLEKYNDYFKTTGTYPPFGEATQPYLFDNPIMNGYLSKIVEDNEPYKDNIPNSIPLYRVKSAKNTNRYFYYVIDGRNFNMLTPAKIPLDNVKINGVRAHNADFYGLPELFDCDVICDIPIYPGANFKVNLYKTYHFP